MQGLSRLHCPVPAVAAVVFRPHLQGMLSTRTVRVSEETVVPVAFAAHTAA